METQKYIDTINVVVVDKKNFIPTVVASFENDSLGTMEAEDLFIKLCQEEHALHFDGYSLNTEELLDNSIFESVDKVINLTHSLNELD